MQSGLRPKASSVRGRPRPTKNACRRSIVARTVCSLAASESASDVLNIVRDNAGNADPTPQVIYVTPAPEVQATRPTPTPIIIYVTPEPEVTPQVIYVTQE